MMKRLILTSSSGAGLAKSKLAEIAVFFFLRFVWGPLPSSEYLDAFLGAQSGTLKLGDHWSDWRINWPRALEDLSNLPLAEFCERYDEIELWFEPSPVDQLQLIWLLDYFGSCPKLLEKLKLRVLASDVFSATPRQLRKSASHIPVVDVTASELETAKMAWRAYCATTPEACVDLVHKDLSALPMLRPVLLNLLTELPSVSTGLGATEMRCLERISRGDTCASFLSGSLSRWGMNVFTESEIEWLLQGLAHGPEPAVAGLDDELRTLDQENPRARGAAHRRSRLSLTDFGKAVLAGEEDFSRYNPIDRWWGGTRLTNDRLWRYGLGLDGALRPRA